MAKKSDGFKKAKEGAKNMAGKVFGEELQRTKKGLFGWLFGLLFGGLLGGGVVSEGSGNEIGKFKDNRFILSSKDERLYFNAKNPLTFEQQKKIGLFEKKMDESDCDFVFFRKNIANIQDEYEKNKLSPKRSPATKKLKMIIKANDFDEQMLIVGSSLGQKQFFKKKNIQKVDKAIGSILFVVASSVLLILGSLLFVVWNNT